MRKPAIMAGFLFFSIAFLFPDSEIVFPFENRIVRYSVENGLLRYEHEADFFFTGLLGVEEKGVWLSARENRKLGLVRFDLKKQEFHKVIMKELSASIILSPYYVTLSRNFQPGKGFEWKLYSLGSPPEILFQGREDLFLSHQILFNGEIFFAGMNKAETLDGVFLINPGTGEKKWVFKNEKEAGFLKFMKYGDSLLLYYSASLAGRKENSLFLWEKSGFRRINCNMPAGYSFFGPGFSLGNNIYIPCIDEKKNIFLGSFQLKKALVHEAWIKAPTGVYLVLKKADKKVIFLGYHYFYSPTDFYLTIFEPSGAKEEKFKKYKLGH